jgi:hypothetical protein
MKGVLGYLLDLILKRGYLRHDDDHSMLPIYYFLLLRMV